MTRLARLLNLAEVRRAASGCLPRVFFDFVDGGADDETSLRANRDAFERVLLRPRVLSGSARRSLATSVLGAELQLPVLLAPAGLATVLHPDGEMAAARAAASAGIVFVTGMGSSYPIEEVVAVAPPERRWAQLYLWRDLGLVARLVERAGEAGCTVLCLTVDAPVSGNKERNRRNQMTIPPRLRPRHLPGVLRRPGWLAGYLRRPKHEPFGNLRGERLDADSFATFFDRSMHRPDQSWRDLEWLRERWPGRLVVKGILRADDALHAAECGADGIVVSNHGGRQLDGALPALAALPSIAAAVGDRVEVLVDGGIRRGTDVVKALALGARACLIGRPWMYGLAVGGEQGVAHVVSLLREEIDRSLALLGLSDVAAVDRSVLADP